ncbi:MAG: DHH family phosphoesterase, partial [Candidatus Aenigmatarchaeota archaeon]
MIILLFIDYIEKIAVYFKDLTKDKIVRIYAQYDPDGISSAAILTKSLLRMNKKFELSFFKQINSKVLSRLKANDKVLVFLDMGSGHLNILKEIIENNKVFIIDHHEPIKYVHENLFHINPHLFDEDPENYCTSILSFIFSLKLDKINEELV